MYGLSVTVHGPVCTTFTSHRGEGGGGPIPNFKSTCRPCPAVVGEASEIDWYSPSGEKILPDRDDFSVSRNDEATSLLIIYKATESSAGIYKCVARSGDKEAQATVELTIFRKSGSAWFVLIAR